VVDEIQLTQTLSRQLSVPWVSLYHVDFSRSLLNLVSREIAERYSLVPILVRRVRKQGDTLYVAMDDPTNEAAIEEVARAASLPVKPMIACPSDIRAAIRVYYLGEAAPAEPARPPALRSVATKDQQRGGAASRSTENLARASQTANPAPPSGEPKTERDSADSSPEIEAKIEEVTAPKRPRPRMIALTLLDGTSISIPAPKRRSRPDSDVPPREEFNDQLTARDLVSALRAVSHGADASEILGAKPHWEALFSALLSILLRKGLIADWEFIEEFRKI
jgi:type IV pilus assembly protein PilB